ncbi:MULTISPECIES: energy-coupling factor transporter transmembrane component T family protein [Streptomyces]|uniref:Cobalt ABC transporter permease n=1 Tax=Streptomyces cacaoi TaxID=1898 RepID=A0A4Y3QZ78_STRCI|nr:MULTISPECIES: energy-coupling factor transporter transmembrane component T [Streptomyces]NNG83422.1 energy-coupling factor transporter transmembrane protein EcfT [Streptomyces cacaoi]GEB49240.1 cobalt ABC transporter permease [Streptomyces cacaoi]
MSILAVSDTSPIHRLNPVTKLVFAFSVTVCGFAHTSALWPLALLLLVLLPAIVYAGALRRFTQLLALFSAPVVVALFLVQGFFYPGAERVIAALGPARLSYEGLIFAAQTALHIMVLVASFLFLLLTTSPSRLMSAMTQRGMSPKIVYVISAALQIGPAFAARAQRILQAQQAHGLVIRGLRGRVRALVPLAGPLILGAFTEIGDRAAAMETRAFGVTRRPTSLSGPLPDSTGQRVARAVMILCAAAAVAVNVWGVIR